MIKNATSQKWRVRAVDVSTGLPKTGDAANITAKISKDFGTFTATNDTNPTEVEAGFYEFDLTQAETNADDLVLIAVSSTSNITVVAIPAHVVPEPKAGTTTAQQYLSDVFTGTDRRVLYADRITLETSGTDAAIDIVQNGAGAGVAIDSGNSGNTTAHAIDINGGVARAIDMEVSGTQNLMHLIHGGNGIGLYMSIGDGTGVSQCVSIGSYSTDDSAAFEILGSGLARGVVISSAADAAVDISAAHSGGGAVAINNSATDGKGLYITSGDGLGTAQAVELRVLDGSGVSAALKTSSSGAGRGVWLTSNTGPALYVSSNSTGASIDIRGNVGGSGDGLMIQNGTGGGSGIVIDEIGTPVNLGDGATLFEMLTAMAGKTSNAGSYDRSTDSIEAIRDRGDSAWITGGGGGSVDVTSIDGSAPAAVSLKNILTGVGDTLTLDKLLIDANDGTAAVEINNAHSLGHGVAVNSTGSSDAVNIVGGDRGVLISGSDIGLEIESDGTCLFMENLDGTDSEPIIKIINTGTATAHAIEINGGNAKAINIEAYGSEAAIDITANDSDADAINISAGDGTGTSKGIVITNNAVSGTAAVEISGAGSARGLVLTSSSNNSFLMDTTGGAADVVQIKKTGGTAGIGLSIAGTGTSQAIDIQGGATATEAVLIESNAANGDGLKLVGTGTGEDLAADGLLNASYLRDMLFERNVVSRHANNKPQQYTAGTGGNQITVETTQDGSGNTETESIV